MPAPRLRLRLALDARAASTILTAALAALAATACSHEITSPDPAVGQIAPDLACNGPRASGASGITTVALTGGGFTPMPSRTLTDRRELILPKITLSPAGTVPGSDPPAGPLDLTDDPAAPDQSRVHWASEAEMSFDVVPADALPAGVYDVTVTNPDGQRAATLAQALAILPPPIVRTAEPMAICDDQADQVVKITGANFLAFDGATPSVSIETLFGTKTYATTVAAGDCAPVPGTFTEHDVRLCTALTFTVPQGDIVVTQNTALDLIITNPPPADCASSTGFQITLNPPPHVDSVVPATVCQGGAQLTINGNNFAPGAKVELVCPGVTVTAAAVQVNATGTQLTATFGGGAPANQSCEVVVTNPDGCADRPLPHDTINVVSGPIVFFADPAVVYNGINTRITIYATTITAPLPSDAVIIQKGATQTTLQFAAVPGHPNRLQAIVPAGQAPGAYDLMLKDGLNCPSTLPGAITVTNATNVKLASVNPPFGRAAADTAVTIFRDTTALPPNDHPFVATPRAFLNPSNPQPTDIAVPLESVAFLDGNRVTGVVPAGTPARTYDVVLVNPDGTVGLLLAGYTATAAAPPSIDAATPASVVAASGQVVTLEGTGFAAGNAVTMTCLTPANTVITAPVVAAAPACTGTCTEQITINAGAVPVGSACVARLTNPGGVFGEFSAVGVTNSSLNLSAPKAGPLLVIGRRALSAASGGATAANRFVYALGGDNGTAAGALASVEAAPVDLFGTVGGYAMQRNSLRAARTLAGAVTLGRYIYLVGGNNGAGPTATAERALILSPREVPRISDVDLQLADVESPGLDAGVYHYRISAVFAASDPHMPGGETLAGDELTIRVPSFPDRKVVLTLVWDPPADSLGTPLANIAGYRIYRTARDGAPGTEVLLASVPATPRTFADDDTGTLGTATPLPLGSTGPWAALPNLAAPREGLAVAAAADPAAPSTFYVYALLGRSSATTALASYEYLTVTAAANGRQTVAVSWTAGALPSGQARWQLGAWTADRRVSTDYTGTATHVFVGPGLTAAGGMATRVESGLVTAGGQLANTSIGLPTTLDDTPRDVGGTTAGYGVCAANDQLFAFGGGNGAPSAGAISAVLATPPPNLQAGAWNSEGLNMTRARYLLGSSVQSAFIFLLGGQTNEPSAASRTTETVIW